jgi:hypothetical protein
LNQSFSNGVADARRGTGDKRALAFELQIHTKQMRTSSRMMLEKNYAQLHYVFGTETVMLRNCRPPV